MTVMGDFLSTANPDTTATLSVTPQEVIVVNVNRNQVVNTGFDESEERVSLSTKFVYTVALRLPVLTSTNAGTLFNWFHSSNLGDGISRSFLWSNPDAADTYTYVVRFKDPNLSEQIKLASLYGLDVNLKVLGKYVP